MNPGVWKDLLIRKSVREIGKFPIFPKFNVMTLMFFFNYQLPK